MTTPSRVPLLPRPRMLSTSSPTVSALPLTGTLMSSISRLSRSHGSPTAMALTVSPEMRSTGERSIPTAMPSLPTSAVTTRNRMLMVIRKRNWSSQHQRWLGQNRGWIYACWPGGVLRNFVLLSLILASHRDVWEQNCLWLIQASLVGLVNIEKETNGYSI